MSETELILLHNGYGTWLRNQFRQNKFSDLLRFCSAKTTSDTRSFDEISALAIRDIWPTTWRVAPPPVLAWRALALGRQLGTFIGCDGGPRICSAEASGYHDHAHIEGRMENGMKCERPPPESKHCAKITEQGGNTEQIGQKDRHELLAFSEG